MDYKKIIDHFYPEENDLKHILLSHGRSVANKALSIVSKHTELPLDSDFVEAAAMLHDIGIVKCHAPRICCTGTEPYIKHGWLGASMLRQHGLEDFARICERHTGAGITLQNIKDQQLPLPQQDFLPETLTEQLICYADKFYSKTHLNDEKSMEEAMKSLERFGEDGVKRFQKWIEMFE